MTTFVRMADGAWQRDDETHENVMVDTRRIPALLAVERVQVEVRQSFGNEELPVGLRAIVGTRSG